jgi:CubicO group peptidase (beta-lactamase class C family)
MDAQSQWTGLDARRLERIGEHLERAYLAPGKIAGGHVSVARHGHLAYSRGFGLMDRERGKPVADDTIYRIYSMTKPITSVALMTLYERGLFQLNDPIARYAPSFANQRVWVSGEGETMVTEPARRPVTFRDLLSHTAGLTYGVGMPGAGDPDPVEKLYQARGVRSIGGVDTMAEFLDRLGKIPLRYHPGEAWMYSLATDVCGALVEIISGRPLEDYLREEILDPLGMTDTAFQVTPDKAERFSANYQRGPSLTLKLLDDPGDSSFTRPAVFKSGGGGLTSTAGDYLRFCEMLRRGGELDGQRILGPRTIELMRANHMPEGRDLSGLAIGLFSGAESLGVGFGLGFATSLGQVESGGLGASDYYWSGAASTLFWVDPAEDLCVVFMVQLMPFGSYDFRGQLKNIVYSAIID